MDPFAPIYSPVGGISAPGLPPLPPPSSPSSPSSLPPWQMQQTIPYGVEIPNRIFVGGCPYNMTEMELNKFFSQYGEVKDAKIITDRDGGKSKGYGFVTFSTEEEAIRVYSKGSLYYQQKKLNVSKAVRKYGGQFQKANQEYLNGQQQQMIWIHPNEGAWSPNQYPSHAQPVKPLYPMVQSPGFYYPQHQPPPPPPPPPSSINPFNGQTYYHAPPSMYTNNNYTESYDTSLQLPDQAYHSTPSYLISTITSTTTSSDNSSSLESSGSSSLLPHPPGHGGGETRAELGDVMERLEIKTKHLSLDSAYTSEVDLDVTHTMSSGASNAANNSNNTDSGTASPTLKEELQNSNDNPSDDPSNDPSDDPSNNPSDDPSNHHPLHQHPLHQHKTKSDSGYSHGHYYDSNGGEAQYVMSPPPPPYNGVVNYCYHHPLPTIQPSHLHPYPLMSPPPPPPSTLSPGYY